MVVIAFVGTGGDHLHTFSLNTSTGKLTLESSTPTAVPSFIAVHPSLKHLYVCNETDPLGSISAFSIPSPPTSELTLLNTVDSRGSCPAHVSVSPSSKVLAAANYFGGSILTFDILTDGSISTSTKYKEWDVNSDPTLKVGPVKSRQEMSHPHQFYWSKLHNVAYVCDLGLDRIVVLDVDTLKEVQVVETKPGCGPRHVLVHPKFDTLYVVNELACSLTVGSIDPVNGFIALGETHELLTDSDIRGDLVKAAAVKLILDKYLLVSQRGQEFIAVFKIHDGSQGKKLELVQKFVLDGQVPRDFDVFEDLVLVALQDTNNIQVLRFSEDKLLEGVDSVLVPNPPQCVVVKAF